MKNLVLITLAILGTLADTTATAGNQNPVSILSTSETMLYLKFNKTMYGGLIEIKDERDSVVFVETISAKKLIIDFFDKKAGKYTVRISKNDVLEIFSYTIVEPAPYHDTVDTAVAYHRSRLSRLQVLLNEALHISTAAAGQQAIC